jgi:hypothetical protein
MPPAGDTCAPRGSGERLIILCTTSGIGRARPYAPVARGSKNFCFQLVGRVFVATQCVAWRISLSVAHLVLRPVRYDWGQTDSFGYWDPKWAWCTGP